MDRRIKKSQDAIMEALISLMAEKDFEKITINEIAERADVNRGTVYAHYTDKYNLLELCVETRLDQLIESCMPVDGVMVEGVMPSASRSSILQVFQMLEQNHLFYSTLLTSKGVPAFKKRLQDMMIQSIRQQLADIHDNLPVQQEVMAQFLASAIVGVVEWWFTQPQRCSAEEITEQLWSLLQLNQMIPGAMPAKQSAPVT
ncbi:TetR/AcrR family transcriptional regulator [Paenibacillus sp. PK3_47]|uniref:TetR/AcrR family transcriptional regulator n=1 Tax=Paenibacillus sp. PK3_47 TaxID=2072642 RepID=UPI00201E1FE1|nr:TetR/AcrR family transcriptional regulator [Paenibacillus sp. PK3_47]UQZ32219.1 TetR/AcrR family transcriptional regulator [Paenibacillus sp. PK3_47]